MTTSHKPRLLYILHCYHNRAGTEEHTRTLYDHLKDEFDVAIAYPEQGRLFLMRPNRDVVAYPAAPVPWPLAPYRSPVVEQSLSNILGLFAPDIIHIQHFFNWPLGMLEQVAATGKPTIITLHDYYAITPYYTMERTANPLDTVSPEYSKMFFRTDISEYLKQRREVLTRGLNRLGVWLTPSPFAARTLNQVFPHDYRVIEHGINPITLTKPRTCSEVLRFGYVGSLLPQKGWIPLLNAFNEFSLSNHKAELTFYGAGQDMRGQNYPGVTFRGAYNQEDLGEIFSDIDVGLIPSVFPETFSLVLSEMWMAGLPVAVSDIGALGERVVDGVNGRKFAPGNSDSIRDVLRWFVENDSWRNWQLPRPRVVADMVDDYRRLYYQLIEKKTG